MDTPETEPAGPDAEGNGARLAAASLIPLLMGGANPKPDTAEGVASLMAQAREEAEAYLRVEPITVIEPETGVEALAVVTRDGVKPISPSIFDGYRTEPRFRRGTATMLSLDSLIAHVNRFGDEDSAVFADDNPRAPKLTAVLDYHRADTLTGDSSADEETRQHGDYRHGWHRTEFAFPLSREWEEWNAMSGKRMSMIEFAVFLERHMSDIALAGDDYPEDVERFVQTRGGRDRVADFSTLVALSRGLKIHEDAVVEEAHTLETGEGHIRFTVEHKARNAAGDTVKVPTLFFISIPVFKRGAFYRIAAALNYRKTAEGLIFTFDLYRPDRSFDHAFNEAVARVDAETEAQVFFGAPEKAPNPLAVD